MTIIQRIQRGSEAVYELASAEIDRGVMAIRAAGHRLAFRVVGLVLATYGVLGVAGAIIIALSPHLGLMWSMLLVSLITITVGLLVCLIASGIGRDSASATLNEARIDAAKAKLSVAFDPPPKDPESSPENDSIHSLKEQVEAALSDPRVLAGAAFAAMSIIGPFRLLKVATRGAGAASAVAALAAAVKSSRVKLPQY